MAAADPVSRVMYMWELTERVMTSPPEARSLENIQIILPFFRTRAPLLHNLRKGM